MTENASGAPAGAGDLLDVNVWLALAVEEHPHHLAARAYWTRHAWRPRFFCRLSAMGLVRLLSHPKLMAERPLTLVKAWALFEGFAALPGVAMLSEPLGVDAALGSLIKFKLPTRLFTDAYFAALARVAGLRLVTFDKDFERFAGLDSLRLRPLGEAKAS